MSNQLLNSARKYLVAALLGRHNSFETRHPWRKDWEFTVLHSLRVEAYTQKILALEPHPLPNERITLLRLAAILHDIARLEVRAEHARYSAELAGAWLREHTDLKTDDIDQVTAMIAAHSRKGSGEKDFATAVLQDADTLDEIGVMSIFMAGNWLENRSPFYFYNLRQHLIDFEIPFCDKQLHILNTRGARSILHKKKLFIENFIAQLEDELSADETTVQLLEGLF